MIDLPTGYDPSVILVGVDDASSVARVLYFASEGTLSNEDLVSACASPGAEGGGGRNPSFQVCESDCFAWDAKMAVVEVDPIAGTLRRIRSGTCDGSS